MTDREFRNRLVDDSHQAQRHAEYFRAKSDWVRCRKKTEQAKGFAELIEKFDTWKSPPKVKNVKPSTI